MKLHNLIATTVLLGNLSVTAQIKISNFPASSRVLARIDVKQLANSKTGELFKNSMDKKATRKLNALTAISGIDFMQDIDAVFISSSGEGQPDGAIYAEGGTKCQSNRNPKS
jgi:hypothetical protein